MRLSIDLDKTLCKLKTQDESYLDVLPMPDAVEVMRFFKSQGYYLIIHTARGMATYNGNVGLINIHRVPDIITWLNKWNIPFDEIVVGKPHCDYFIDDKSVHFNTWLDVKYKILDEEKIKNT